MGRGSIGMTRNPALAVRSRDPAAPRAAVEGAPAVSAKSRHCSATSGIEAYPC
jgi:hypothetical protein